MTTVYMKPNYILINVGYRQPSVHHHLAKHIILSLDGDLICTINSNGDLCCKGIIIDSSVLHTVQSRNNKLLVFLIDEASSLAQDMKKNLLCGASYSIIPPEMVCKMRRTYKKSVDLQETTRKQYDYFCHRTFSLLNLNFEEQIAKDDRIQWALNHVSNASSIDTETISAICRSVHLSQSRFSHLFKEQVGV